MSYKLVTGKPAERVDCSVKMKSYGRIYLCSFRAYYYCCSNDIKLSGFKT